MGTIFERLFELLTDPNFMAGLLLITFVTLYAVYSLILALQIKRLTQTVNQHTFAPIFQLLAIINAFAAVLLIFVVLALI